MVTELSVFPRNGLSVRAGSADTGRPVSYTHLPFTTTDAPITPSPVASLTIPVHVPVCCVIFTS